MLATLDPRAGRFTESPLGAGLARVIDALGFGVLLVDGEGHVGLTNQKARAIFSSRLGPQLEAFMPVALQRFKKTEPQQLYGEATVRSSDGLAVRLILAPTDQQGISFVVLEELPDSRVRQELNALHTVIQGRHASDDAVARIQTSLMSLGAALPSCRLTLYRRRGSKLVALSHVGDNQVLPRLPEGEVLEDQANSTLSQALISGIPAHTPYLSQSAYPTERARTSSDEAALLALPVNPQEKTPNNKAQEERALGVLAVCAPPNTLSAPQLRLLQSTCEFVGLMLGQAAQEERADASDQAYQSLLEQLPDVVLEVSREGLILAATDQADAVFGYPSGGCEGDPLAAYLCQEETGYLNQIIAAVCDGEERHLAVEIQRDRGALVPCELTLFPTNDSQRARAILRDVSVRRGLERQVDLARAAAASTEQLASIGRLAAGVAHEINTPLAYVRSNLSVIGSFVSDLLPLLDDQPEKKAEAETLFEDITEIADDCVHGIDRISEIVRALKGSVRRDAEAAPFDIAKAVRNAVTIFSGARKHTCQVSLNVPELPYVRGQSGKLAQVILNLLENGLDAMGGQGDLEVSAIADKEWVDIHVRDFGPGIPSELATKIFAPFFTTKEVGKGTGLGLYICLEIANQIGGRLNFALAEPGTRFTLRLPIAELGESSGDSHIGTPIGYADGEAGISG